MLPIDHHEHRQVLEGEVVLEGTSTVVLTILSCFLNASAINEVSNMSKLEVLLFYTQSSKTRFWNNKVVAQRNLSHSTDASSMSIAWYHRMMSMMFF